MLVEARKDGSCVKGARSPDVCPSCLSSTAPLVEVGTHRSDYNQIEYTRLACAGCALEFWSPLKADESVYQGEGYVAYEDYHRGERPFPRWAEPLFEWPDLRPGKSLDIGCADGAVMLRLRENGFAVRGIDLDATSIGVATARLGEGVATASTLADFAEDATSSGATFDLITFFEVLEHQDNPLAFLRQVKSLLARGGVVAGSVPNRERFLVGVDRRLNDGDLPPHHFLWFSRPALKVMLARAGFSSVEVTTVGAMPYLEVIRRVRRVLARQSQIAGSVRKSLIAAANILAPVLAVLPYIGYRLKPSHLFFRCRI